MPKRTVERSFLTAEWRHLVMLNFRVDPALLAPLVPRGTLLDTWRGDHWLSLVGFQFLDTRVLGAAIPWHRSFPEINLRFYVRPESDARRAVVFVKEIVPRRAISLIARFMYNEPYATRAMKAEAPASPVDTPGRISYAWRHRGRWNRIGATAVGEAAPILDDSDEMFIAEHYWGYTRQRDGSTIEYAVEHPRWSVWRTTDVLFDVDAASEYGPALGEALRGPPATVFIANGSPVRVGLPTTLPDAGSAQ